MSSRIRRLRPALHRAVGKVFIGSVSIAAPAALAITVAGFEPRSIVVEQWFQSGGWLISPWIAYACIRSGQMPLHKAWMMRSYAFTLIFIFSRVPDYFMPTESDQFLSDLLWSQVVVAALAPELILTAQTLWRVRSAKARHAAAMPEVIEDRGFNALKAELEAFAAAIGGGPAYPIPPDQILHGVAAFEAIIRSAAERRSVKVARS